MQLFQSHSLGILMALVMASHRAGAVVIRHGWTGWTFGRGQRLNLG